MSSGIRHQWGFRDKIQDNFPLLTISKFDIGLIKMLFCSVANMEPLKMRIWLHCIDHLAKTLSTNSDCAFKSIMLSQHGHQLQHIN